MAKPDWTDQGTESSCSHSANHQVWRRNLSVSDDRPSWKCYSLKSDKNQASRDSRKGPGVISLTSSVQSSSHHATGAGPGPWDTRTRLVSTLKGPYLCQKPHLQCMWIYEEVPRRTHTWFMVNPWILSPSWYCRALSQARLLFHRHALWCACLD